MARQDQTSDTHVCNDRAACVATRCPHCHRFEHIRPYELAPECLRRDLAACYVEGGWCGSGLLIQLDPRLGSAAVGVNIAGDKIKRAKPGPTIPGFDVDASDLLRDVQPRWRSADQPTLADWRRQARTILGFAVPSVALPDRSCFACGQQTLRVAADAQSNVWCANPLCHDWDRYPDCEQGENGRPACRRTERALTHAVRWRPDSWAPLLREIEHEHAA